MGWGGGCFDTSPLVSSNVQYRLLLAATLVLISYSQLNQASAENDYHDNCRAQWEVQTVTHCPGWRGSKSWYQGNLVPRVLSYPPYGARERETLENAGHVAPEENYF